MDGGTWQATVLEVTKGWTRLKDKHFHFFFPKPLYYLLAYFKWQYSAN